MGRIIAVFLIAGFMASIAGCSKKEEVTEEVIVETVPGSLTNIAVQFKAKVGGDRKALANEIIALMPTCADKVNDSGFASVDYTSPSYYISRTKIEELLGTPDLVDGDLLVYTVLKETKTRWELLLQVYDGFIVSGKMDAALIKRR